MYVLVDVNEPLHQGDIFHNLPLTQTDVANSPVRRPDGTLLKGGWLSNLDSQPLLIEVGATLTSAILANQDCDVEHSPVLTFYAIVPLSTTGIQWKSNPARRWRGIVRDFKANVKFYYLRADGPIGFAERMAVSFSHTMQFSRASIDQHKAELRRGKLTDEALVHFRESVARYYTRLAYSEQYSFDAEELEAYAHDHEDHDENPRGSA